MADRLEAIPSEFIPLFEAKTAHESVRAAVSLLQQTPPGRQAAVLADPLFQKAVTSAFAGLDECAAEHIPEILSSVSPEYRDQVSSLLSDLG